MSTLNPNQVNTSVLGMLSAVITSACTALVTTAIKGNEAIAGLFGIVIHAISAGEHIAEAVEGRAKIYGEHLVKNGALAEREGTLKHVLRLKALEAQEQSASVKPAAKPVKPAKSTKPKVRATGRPTNAASAKNTAHA